jgi:type I restriction enzyme M protein
MALDLNIKNNKVQSILTNEWYPYSEKEEVKQRFIYRMIKEHGYVKEQIAENISIKNINDKKEIIDIGVWKSIEEKSRRGFPDLIIIIECKPEFLSIRKRDFKEGIDKANRTNAIIFVAANSKETKIYKVDKKAGEIELQKLKNFPSAELVADDKKLEKFFKDAQKYNREEFSRILFKCHNIIRNNDKLSPETAFDEISKILFIKIKYEREKRGEKLFTLEGLVQDEICKYGANLHENEFVGEKFVQFLFDETKRAYEKDELFDLNELIRIRNTSFSQIVKELEEYNLSDTSDDIKGIAFEEFLGKTFRGELGQFFTPRTVVDFMVEVLEPQEGEIICDPCCGSGGFLIKAFEYVRSKIEKEIIEAKEKIKAELFDEVYEKASDKEKEHIEETANRRFAFLNAELDINNPNSRLRRLSYDCIYGTDANPRMARTSKMNMIMHGDGHGGVHHHDGLLNVNGIFEERFDVILTNPPFGARVEKSLKITETDKFTDEAKIKYYTERYGNDYLKALKQVNDNINKPILDLYDVGKLSSLTEVLFIERCFRLLAKGGRMAIVLPEGVLNNTNLQQVRDFFESKAKIILITSIPQDVFIASGATVKPSLLFFKKFTEEEEKQYKKIRKEAEKTIKEKYQEQITELGTFIAERSNPAQDKKEKRAELAALEKQMQEEIKALVKEKFDYQIPIAEVEKAGITTTGAECDNELEQLAVEFKEYRKKKNIWKEKLLNITYAENGTGFFRYVLGEPQEIYAKQ